MSGDEGQDVELRELVAQTLENNGVLPKIRAELRASVFLALEDQESATISHFVNKPLKEFASSAEGSLVLSLVRELLEYFELDNTLSVFDPETKHGKDYAYGDRGRLARDLKLDDDGSGGPLLAHVLRLARQDGSAVPVDTDTDHSAENPVQRYDGSAVPVDTDTDHSAENPAPAATQSRSATEDTTHNRVVTSQALQSKPPLSEVGKSTNHSNGIAEPVKPAVAGGASLLGNLPPLAGSVAVGAPALLGNLPPLAGSVAVGAPAVKEKKREELDRLERDMLALGLDTLDHNYEEDFASSPSPSKTSNNSEIEEEVPVSAAEDGLSAKSAPDDGLTIDATLSTASGLGDHMEDL